ncbi:phosphatidylinositol N-acetylglucosaminyltransferase [Exidia glandulosa HHB12029]|uniref:Phosphatidylinositol N-acetylglucosaminyltransferase n=1 Tax=Exidia glandulosa HHB12029 TaxID=1314781 RepID=A0A165R201_EXIGL|nr:phosphatidylinositol N-acetylglucosaminyltransferase [Exidia glandulosa HHB12029]
MAADGEVKWEKVLWRTQPFPDNYVPDSFLDKLRKNTNFRPYSFRGLVLAACAITQHLSTIFIFISVFVRLNDSTLDPRVLVWVTVATHVLGSIVWDVAERPFYEKHERRANRAKAVKSSLMVFLALIGLSPVLKTLTAATSSDSIWALSAGLFVINALLADYREPASVPRKEGLISVLSMNAAISASVVLASRLPTNLSVFALMLLSIQLFALFPILRKRIQAVPAVLHFTFTVCIATASVWSMHSLSPFVASLFAGTLLFVTFGGPGLLMWAQQYKNEIRGPWDVAVPRVRPDT